MAPAVAAAHAWEPTASRARLRARSLAERRDDDSGNHAAPPRRWLRSPSAATRASAARSAPASGTAGRLAASRTPGPCAPGPPPARADAISAPRMRCSRSSSPASSRRLDRTEGRAWGLAQFVKQHKKINYVYFSSRQPPIEVTTRSWPDHLDKVDEAATRNPEADLFLAYGPGHESNGGRLPA